MFIASALVPSLAAEAQETVGPLRVGASYRPLPTMLAETFADQTQVRAAMLPAGGSCVAWVDRRQGGVVMMTRISASGVVLDPLGIPLEWGYQIEPLAVLPAQGGCVVVHRARREGWSYSVAGSFIDWNDPSPIPVRRFDLAVESGYVVEGGDRALVVELVAEGSRLYWINADGVIASRLYNRRFSAVGTRVGETWFLLRHDGVKQTLWKISPSFADEQISDMVPSNSTVRLFPDGDGVLLVSMRGAHLEVVRYGPDGTILDWRDRTLLEHSGIAGVVEEGGAQHLLVPQSSGTVVIELNDELTPVGTVSLPATTVASTDGRQIYLYRDRTGVIDRAKFEINSGLPNRQVSPLTFSPAPELVIDVEPAGEKEAAVIWAERSLDLSLRLGFSSLENLAKLSPIDVDQIDSAESAAVAWRDGITMVAWVRDGSLWYRRLGENRQWLDSAPQLLSPEPTSISHGSLIATDEGFVVLWGGEESELRQVTIPISGDRIERVLGVTGTSSRTFATGPPIIVARPESFLVLTFDPTFLCRICTCPPPLYPVLGERYDRNWVPLGTLFEPGAIATSGWLDFATEKDWAVVTAEEHLRFLRVLEDGRVEASVVDVPFSPRSLVHVNDRFVATGLEWNSSLLHGTIVNPKTFATTPFTLSSNKAVNPWNGWPHRLVEIDGKLLLFASEVSDRPDEGSVPRLRIHVLEWEPVPDRRRVVRRSGAAR